MGNYRYFSDGPRVMVDDEGDVKYVLTVDYYGPEPSARSAKWVAEELNKVVCLNGAMTPAISSNPPAPDDASEVNSPAPQGQPNGGDANCARPVTPKSLDNTIVSERPTSNDGARTADSPRTAPDDAARVKEACRRIASLEEIAQLRAALEAAHRLPLMREDGETTCPYCHYDIPKHGVGCEWMNMKALATAALGGKS